MSREQLARVSSIALGSVDEKIKRVASAHLSSPSGRLPPIITLHRVRIPRIVRLIIIQPPQSALLRDHPPQDPFVDAQRVLRLRHEGRRRVKRHLHKLCLRVRSPLAPSRQSRSFIVSAPRVRSHPARVTVVLARVSRLASVSRVPRANPRDRSSRRAPRSVSPPVDETRTPACARRTTPRSSPRRPRPRRSRRVVAARPRTPSSAPWRSRRSSRRTAPSRRRASRRASTARAGVVARRARSGRSRASRTAARRDDARDDENLARSSLARTQRHRARERSRPTTRAT